LGDHRKTQKRQARMSYDPEIKSTTGPVAARSQQLKG
jgi:hypothetical protein